MVTGLMSITDFLRGVTVTISLSTSDPKSNLILSSVLIFSGIPGFLTDCRFRELRRCRQIRNQELDDFWRRRAALTSGFQKHLSKDQLMSFYPTSLHGRGWEGSPDSVRPSYKRRALKIMVLLSKSTFNKAARPHLLLT